MRHSATRERRRNRGDPRACTAGGGTPMSLFNVATETTTSQPSGEALHPSRQYCGTTIAVRCVREH